MKYTAEEVRAKFEAFLFEEAWLGEGDKVNYERGDICRMWASYKAAYAERIEADKEVGPTEAVLNKAVEVFLSVAPEWNDYLVKDGMRAALLAVWPNPPAQPAERVPTEFVEDIQRAERLALKSKKLNRERMMGLAVLKHFSHLLTAAQQADR